MTYTTLSEAAQSVILMISCMTFIMFLYYTIRMTDLGRKKLYRLLAVLETLFSFGLFQLLIMIQQKDISVSFPLPLFPTLAMVCLLFMHAALLHRRIAIWEKEHLSAISVKEAFDRLPMGLMFYSASGIPIMVNGTMQAVARELFGSPVTDAVAFWERLGEADRSDRKEPEDDSRIVGSSEEKVYGFRRGKLAVKGSELYELTAVDISWEYGMTRELGWRRDRAGNMNSRLKALMSAIEYVSMNKELLQLKAALHDNIGQSILIAKRYLYAPGSVDKKRMLDFWTDNIRHLINGEPEEWELPYYVISREADRLGIRLNIIGELPEKGRLIPVVDAAVSAHIGNTLKHADGTEATIAVQKQGKDYILSFTNNGRQPEGEIRERGGLQNLRREVESIGGRMELYSKPAFEMKLILPGEE